MKKIIKIMFVMLLFLSVVSNLPVYAKENSNVMNVSFNTTNTIHLTKTNDQSLLK